MENLILISVFLANMDSEEGQLRARPTLQADLLRQPSPGLQIHLLRAPHVYNVSFS